MNNSPDLLPSISPSFSERLRTRADELLCKIIRGNFNTQFALATSELAEFRGALSDLDDDGTLSDTFRRTVQFTTYDSYAPFVAGFFEKPCKVNTVVNLLAPGLPDCILGSSSTSGGHPKTFPKYNRFPKHRSTDVASPSTSDLQRRTTAHIWSLWCNPIDVVDEEDHTVATVYLSTGSAVWRRWDLNLMPEKDEEKMGKIILNHAAPYAAGFVKKWRSFLLIHALFAVGSKFIETISMGFMPTFVDFMHHLDAEFDTVLDCIANGIIPDLEGIEEVRHYLEPNLLPDPERAEELRNIGCPSSRPGWCSYVWPKLHSVITITGGPFRSSVPLAQWYLGPTTKIKSGPYTSTEALIGLPCNPDELNHFKANSATVVIEFLDVDKSDSINSLAQLWEVQVQKRYEIVVTTADGGLWRYRLGDVVEVIGFDPKDGVPIIQFIERRDVVIRFPNFMVTENELRTALFLSIPAVNVVDWTTTIDDRRVPQTITFFVELVNNQVSDMVLRAPDQILDTLAKSNENIARALANERFRKPTVQLVRSGTFSDFRQLKLDQGSNNVGQIKVPVVLPKPTYVTWLSDRVVKEL